VKVWFSEPPSSSRDQHTLVITTINEKTKRTASSLLHQVEQWRCISRGNDAITDDDFDFYRLECASGLTALT
jgi:hypothetical protein